MSNEITQDENGRLSNGQFGKNNNIWMQAYDKSVIETFSTAKNFLKGAKKYFEFMVNNPLYEVEQRKAYPKNATIITEREEVVMLPKQRPFTIRGLCLYLGVNGCYFKDLKERLTKDKNQEYLEAIKVVEDVIFNQKLELGLCGMLNPTLVAMSLGLKQKIENQHTLKMDDYSQYSTEELIKRAEAVSKIEESSAEVVENTHLDNNTPSELNQSNE